MSSKIYKVFISSSFEDLIEERKKVIEGLLLNRFFPVAMEFFESSDDRSIDSIESSMIDCDYYILIIKGKYGSIESESGKSYTELECQLAVKLNLGVLAFVYKDENELKKKEVETEPDRHLKLETFRNYLKATHTVRMWDSPEALNNLIIQSLNAQLIKKPAVGFEKIDSVRAFQNSKLDLDEVKKQETKVAYFRFLHLTRKAMIKRKRASYERYISRLGASIPVYDEIAFYQVNDFPVEVSGFEISNFTTGVVDLTMLHPWQPELFFPEGASQSIPQSIGQTFRESAKTFTTVSHFFNAFQENQYLRTKMEKMTGRATLIVDFSYLMVNENIIDVEKIKGSLAGTSTTDIRVCKNPVHPSNDTFSPAGIYWITGEDLQKDDILKIDFSDAINWDNLETSL
ncbi:MAG: DUF4062 domain-containing protein [Bacteroidota bacterium]|nr:DUF4062 domain-containing protein [Bacteroidota bacterium]